MQHLLPDFRIFYNHTVRPELIRLESERLQLLQWLGGFVLLAVGVLFVQLYFDIFPLTVVLLLPLIFYLSQCSQKIRRFKTDFKPRIVRLILSFLEDKTSAYQHLTYHPKRSISQKKFNQSKIFYTDEISFRGEDLLAGMVGELRFEGSELLVREPSSVRSGFKTIFRGVFFYADWGRPLYGEILVVPRANRQYLSRSIRNFAAEGGEEVSSELRDLVFSDVFATFATSGTPVASLLSPEIRGAILQFRERAGKEIYLSFVGSTIYVGVGGSSGILEPSIFRSNISYDFVLDYFDLICLFLGVIEDFDNNN